MRKTVAELGFIKKDPITDKDLQNWLYKEFSQICERFVIGNETGEEGYAHFQCRIVLKKDTWKPQDLLLWAQYNGIGGHWSPTKVRNFEYVEKEGEYIRSWEEPLKEYVTITPNLWQIIALDQWKKQNDRQILCIIDTKGGHGKTFLRKHLVATHQAQFIPPMEKAEDIMAVAMAKPSKGYVIDLPRADGKAKKPMWSAIEQIKDGYLYDKRYNWREKWIAPPKIMVFCNDFNASDLSTDRWQDFEISDFQQEV